MLKIVITVVLISQIIHGLPLDFYNFECNTAECADGHTFVPAPYCGCFKPEDIKPSNLQQLIPSYLLPFYQSLLTPGGTVPQPQIPLSVPDEVVDPLTPPAQVPILVANPTQPPNQLPPVPDQIPQIQVVSNNSIHCNGQSTLCSQGLVFDLRICQCICVQQQQCRFHYQVFNPSTCQCEPHACPNECSRCETQDRATCACKTIFSCPVGQIINSQTCQCSCNNGIQCNRLQRLNPNTCQCECLSFTTTTEQVITRPSISSTTIPSPIGNIRPDTSLPDSTRSETRSETSSETRNPRHRHRHRGRLHRHRGRKHIADEEIQLYANDRETERNDIALLRMKRVKNQSRSNSRSRSGSRSDSGSVPQSAQSVQQATRTIVISIPKQVFACPVGKTPVQSTCTCN